MYNADLKNQFIQSYTKSEKTSKLCETLFNSMEPYEITWDSDLCTVDTQTLINAISKISGVRKRTQTSVLGIFKAYVKWCIDNNIDGACDGLLQVRDIGEEVLRSKMVWSPRDLQSYLDSIFEHESELTVDNTYRCFYWLAYGGMSEDDILLVKTTDVDLINRRVIWRGDVYPIYEEALQCFRNCALLNEFVLKRNYITSVPRIDGRILIRGTKGELSTKSLRTILSRKISAGFSNTTDIRLTYYRAWLSGLFYRLSILEKSDFQLTNDVLLNVIQKNASLAEKIGSPTDTKTLKFLSEIKRDYENWKRAGLIPGHTI